MKRLLIMTAAVLALSIACACAATLPVDIASFPETKAPDGTTVLEFGGPVLPAGTEYTLIKVVETDESRNITNMTRPFHRFAHIAYRDANGQQQKAWVMDYARNTAVAQPLPDEAAAEVYARRIFSSRYLLAQQDVSIRITAQPGGWLAEAVDADGNATHSMLFDQNGMVAHLRDVSFDLPDLSAGAIYSNELSDQADACGAMSALEWISRELFPDVLFNSVPCYFYDEARNAYTFFVDSFDYYMTVAVEDDYRLLAYGDLRQMDGGYGSYLTRGEACAAGKQALQNALGLDDLSAVSLSSASFVVSEPAWVEYGNPAVCWELYLQTNAENVSGGFWVTIDAESGEALAANPEEGNG